MTGRRNITGRRSSRLRYGSSQPSIDDGTACSTRANLAANTGLPRLSRVGTESSQLPAELMALFTAIGALNSRHRCQAPHQPINSTITCVLRHHNRCINLLVYGSLCLLAYYTDGRRCQRDDSNLISAVARGFIIGAGGEAYATEIE